MMRVIEKLESARACADLCDAFDDALDLALGLQAHHWRALREAVAHARKHDMPGLLLGVASLLVERGAFTLERDEACALQFADALPGIPGVGDSAAETIEGALLAGVLRARVSLARATSTPTQGAQDDTVSQQDEVLRSTDGSK